MNIGELFKKSKKSIKEEGIKNFLVKAKNWTIFQFKKDKRKEEIKDVLFINGCTLPHPERYRVAHQIEQLEANGLTADQRFYTLIKPEMIKFYRCIIIFRCPYTKEIREIIKKAHYFNKKVFFDIDDLVIDKKYTDNIKFVQSMSKEEKKEYDDGVTRMGKTMGMCDYIITTTSGMANELKKYGKEVFVNRNVASEEMVRLSIDAVQKIKRDKNEIIIGYLSGSITHNPDFELIRASLIKIMKEFSNVKLLVMGYLDIPEDFEEFKDRIILRKFTDWRKLPEIIASLDINLAPIEKTIFNNAKSENKWTEASLCKVVTVASNFGAFKEVVKDGQTGVLCNGEEWYEKIKRLILDEKLRKEIGENAYNKVIEEKITTYTGFKLVKFIESKLNKNIAFILPSTNISGGVNVVLKHCDILRKNGWDSMVINMDTSDENFKSNDFEINVVSGVTHEVKARFYGMVATLYTTLDYIKTQKDINKKFYFVQNFETNFSDYGSPLKRVANATYNALGDVQYITISKWCKEWLADKYEKKAKIAQNGIDLKKFNFKMRIFKNDKVKILVEGNSDDYYKNVDESFAIVEKLDPNKFEINYLSYQGEPKKWYRVDNFFHRVSHDEVAKIYSQSDILLKSSILESFSYPPLEMMATGGFCVVRPNEGNIEYLVDQENCLFYEPGNIDDAVDKINQLINDEELRIKLTKNMKKTVRSRDWSKVEKEVLDLYSE